MLVGSSHGPEPYDWSRRPPSRPKAAYSEIGDKARHKVIFDFVVRGSTSRHVAFAPKVIATCREGPIVVIVCMLDSSESWEPQQRPLPWRSAPVEEPSTASISDIAASAISGKGLVYLSPHRIARRGGEHRTSDWHPTGIVRLLNRLP